MEHGEEADFNESLSGNEQVGNASDLQHVENAEHCATRRDVKTLQEEVEGFYASLTASLTMS